MIQMTGLLRSAVLAGVGVLALAGGALAQDLKTVVARASYDDVKFELSNAIVAKGLAVESEGNVAAMLDRTAADVGASKKVYKNAGYFAFCSARYSRMIMEADPAGVAFCPFTIFLYETAEKPGDVVVGYRRFGAAKSPATAKAFAEAEALFDAILAQAVK